MNLRRRLLRFLIVSVAASLLLIACTNDAFDPASVPNDRPTMRFFVEPVDPDGELNSTSYFDRTFHWSGSDRDGHVVEYYVSVRFDPDVPAPWDTTTRTDTTMTFRTDDDGNAEATFHLACRDDQGALSDTLVRYVPLRNFPPAVNFQSDFDPLRNLQREYVFDGGAVIDTVYWNWGAMNLRLFAFDLDGRETMDGFYRYTAADEDPTEVRAWDDPAADPMLHWIEVPFVGASDIRQFEVFLSGLPAGQRTVTVAVSDEADAETRLTYTWEVREPASGVLLVPDNSTLATRAFYRGFAADYLGADGWDEYDFWFGYPDNDFVLLESLRAFDLVMWFDGGSTSQILQEAARRNGPLESYLLPADGAEAGRLLMISRNLTGSGSDLPYYFRQNVIGVSPTGAPESELVPTAWADSLQVFGNQSWLPSMTLVNLSSRGIGLALRPGTQELYRFESCRQPDPPYAGCLSLRPPYDPIIATRRPLRSASDLARTVGVSFPLEAMIESEAWAVLAALFEYELGVASP